MKSTLALIAFAAGVIAQQSIPGLPTCAQTCVNLPQQCQTTDFKCICGDKDFITNISCCVSQKCSSSDQATVIKFASGLCGSYGVTVPTQATCASGSGPASTQASSGGAAGGSSATTSSGPMVSQAVINGTVTTSVTVTATTTTTANSAAATSAKQGSANNLAPQAGILLGGVMAGMALL